MYDEAAGCYTSSIGRIIQLVEEAWDPVLNRHRDAPPSWDASNREYGRYDADLTPAPTGLPDGARRCTIRRPEQKKPPLLALTDGGLPSCNAFKERRVISALAC